MDIERVNINTQAVEFEPSAPVEVVDQASLALGVAKIQDVKCMLDQIEETFKPHISRAHEQHKALLGSMNKFKGPLVELETQQKARIKFFVENVPEVEPVKGLSFRSNPSLTVGDDAVMKIAALVAKGKLPAKVLKVDTKTIKDLLEAGIEVPECSLTPGKSITVKV